MTVGSNTTCKKSVAIFAYILKRHFEKIFKKNSES